MNEYKGAGWYRIGFSDGGQDWTNDGPIWLDSEVEYDGEMEAARATETETHLVWSEYIGDRKRFEEYELDAFLGEYADDFDRDAIVDEVTEMVDGNRYWRELSPDEVNEICRRHDKTA